MCVVCSVHVKSEILWNTHLQSRKHKDSVAALKAKKPSPSVSAPSPAQPKESENGNVKGLAGPSSDSPLVTMVSSGGSGKRERPSNVSCL